MRKALAVVNEKKERYSNIDGLRVISCICIIAMHIKANADYHINNWIYHRVIGSWGQLVALFLIISGFAMFCGYYEDFRAGKINLSSFYTKRYKKILPFFATLVIIDILLSRSVEHIIQGIAEITLVFGLLPNNDPDVIGVCWTLGVIFLFYMLFPFVVFTCWNKKRALITEIVSIIISILCSIYFYSDQFVIETFTPRHNILYCAPWIIGGGVVFLYRDDIKKFVSQYRWFWLAGCIGLDIIWHISPGRIYGVDIIMLKNLILYVPCLMYAISVKSKILSNRGMKYLSGMSLELYLAQMVIFRVIEKGHCLYLVGKGWVGFIATWVLEIIGLIVFIELFRWAYRKVSVLTRRNCESEGN